MNLGRIRQGLHEAKEGLNFAKIHNLSGWTYAFTTLLNEHRHPKAQQKLDLSLESAWNEIDKRFQ